MDECIRLPIVTLDKSKTLHRVEELHGSARPFAGELTLRAAAGSARTTRLAGFTRTVGNRKGFAIDLQIGRGDLAATVDERETQRLTLCETRQTSLFNRTDMDENIFLAVVTNNEAETLLSVEEFYDAATFADDLGRHTAAKAAATATAAEASTVSATATVASTAAAAEAAAIATAAAADAAAASTVSTAAADEAAAIAEAATVTKSSAEPSAALIRKTAKIVAADIVPFVPAASAATFIKTHALLITFASPKDHSDEHAGRRTCAIHRKIKRGNRYNPFYTQGRPFCERRRTGAVIFRA